MLCRNESGQTDTPWINLLKITNEKVKQNATCSGSLVPRPGIKSVAPCSGSVESNHWTTREVSGYTLDTELPGLGGTGER